VSSYHTSRISQSVMILVALLCVPATARAQQPDFLTTSSLLEDCNLLTAGVNPALDAGVLLQHSMKAGICIGQVNGFTQALTVTGDFCPPRGQSVAEVVAAFASQTTRVLDKHPELGDKNYSIALLGTLRARGWLCKDSKLLKIMGGDGSQLALGLRGV